MVDIRAVNGGMNMDSAIELLRQGEYTYAMNVSVGSEGMVNMLGNRPADGFPPNTSPGSEWICGAFFDKVRQRIIYFTNHERSYHRILSYEVPSSSSATGNYIVLFQDNPTQNQESILGWPTHSQYIPNGLIKDIKVIHREIEGDLYYFIDPNKKLRKFNYNTLISWQAIDSTLCAFGWTAANYDGITLNDGTTPIIQVQDPTVWAGLTVPAWCYYNNNSNNGNTYGKLYNWYAVSHPNFAPVGYRVPTDTDWTNLTNCLGGELVAGGKMKSTSTLWSSPNIGGTNESLFNGLPGGYRDIDGTFNAISTVGNWWSASESSTADAWYRGLNYDTGDVLRLTNYKTFGFSVRLIKQ